MNFFSLKEQNESIKAELEVAINRVVDSGIYIMGDEVNEFEKSLAAYCGTKYAIGVNSGTDALYLSLWAMDIGPGDEVITTPFTFIATAEVIAMRGAKPVFVDIDPGTFNIDPAKIEEKITSKTKAIMPVHIFGYPAKMDDIMRIAERHNLKVIEDAAQAIGSEYYKQKIGSFGDTGCFSFFPTKNLSCFGDGGAVVTSDENLYERIMMIRQHGSKIKYQNDTIGLNSRLDAIQASILRVKLKYLDKWNDMRINLANRYSSSLETSNIIDPPIVNNNLKHVYHQYTVRVKDRAAIVKRLERENIPYMIYYEKPLYKQKALSYLGIPSDDFPETERACLEVLSLPIYPELSSEDQKEIISTLINV